MNDSRSPVLYHLSTRSRSSTSGMKSLPMPSTLYWMLGCSSFRLSGCARIEPCGSAPITLTCGLCFFRPLARPVTVPPVPTPATMAVMRPPVCSQISSAVPYSCARGLSELLYWSRMWPLGIFLSRRLATLICDSGTVPGSLRWGGDDGGANYPQYGYLLGRHRLRKRDNRLVAFNGTDEGKSNTTAPI